jgi:hypothetical protein
MAYAFKKDEGAPSKQMRGHQTRVPAKLPDFLLNSSVQARAFAIIDA